MAKDFGIEKFAAIVAESVSLAAVLGPCDAVDVLPPQLPNRGVRWKEFVQHENLGVFCERTDSRLEPQRACPSTIKLVWERELSGAEGKVCDDGEAEGTFNLMMMSNPFQGWKHG